MNAAPVAITAAGMMTGVGLSFPATAAAMRAGVDGFAETRFIDKGGEWIIGCQVSLDEPWRGRPKLLRMVAPAIAECLATLATNPERPISAASIPIIMNVAEPERPGRFDGVDASLLVDLAEPLTGRKNAPLNEHSTVIAGGRAGGVRALSLARDLLGKGLPAVIVAGADTYLTAGTLREFEDQFRLLTSKNSDGFIPGEAGAAILLQPATPDGQVANRLPKSSTLGPLADERSAAAASGARLAARLTQPLHPAAMLNVGPPLLVTGLGFGEEKATVTSGQPLRADGLVQACRAAFAEAGIEMGGTDYRIGDCNGEQYRFKEATLAQSRLLRARKEFHFLWQVNDCLGEIGAATVPACLAMALAAHRKEYAPGLAAIAHFGNDGVERAALVLRGVPHRAATEAA